jgi:peptide deformylase
LAYKVPKDLPAYRLLDPETPEGVEPTVMINAKYEPIDDEMQESWEGCLSMPGLYGNVPRYLNVRVIYQTMDGELHEKIARHFEACVLQHEIDHLDGILYVERIQERSGIRWGENLGYTQEMRESIIDSFVEKQIN